MTQVVSDMVLRFSLPFFEFWKDLIHCPVQMTCQGLDRHFFQAMPLKLGGFGISGKWRSSLAGVAKRSAFRTREPLELANAMYYHQVMVAALFGHVISLSAQVGSARRGWPSLDRGGKGQRMCLKGSKTVIWPVREILMSQ